MQSRRKLFARTQEVNSYLRQSTAAYYAVAPFVWTALAIGSWTTLPIQSAMGQTLVNENLVSQNQVNEKQEAEATESSSTDEAKELISKLEKYLSGAQLKGRFTIIGRDFSPKEEQYTIVEAKKLEKGDYWSLKARIKYGEIDQTIPLVLQIKWADKTPVITLEKMTIPGMGTFSARVLFNGGMYSGTWKHDDVGGHLFGEVIPKDAANDQESQDSDSKE